VRRAGDDVRITAQLIQTSDGFHLWSETFDRQLTDIFAVQEEIADAIADKLELTLTAEGKNRLARRRTEDLEAYDLYLLGRHNYGTRTDTGLVKAREYFEAAIAIDSMFAPAWAGLAGVYNALPWYVRGYDPRETSRTSFAAVQKALELDPNLAEAHAVSGVTYHEYLWNWERAEEHYLRATELDPDYAQAWNWYCQLLSLLDRVAEGIEACKRAGDGEPLVKRYAWLLGFQYAAADSTERAIPLYEEAVTSDQALPEMWGEFSNVLIGAGEYEKAAWALEGWVRADGLEGPERMATVAAAITDPSLRPEAIEIVEDFEAQGLSDPYFYVAVWTALGETDRALDLLEEMFEVRNPNVIFLGVAPWMDPLRGESRFQRLIEELDLPGDASGRSA
jgi:tetratricopeptide (TPR) repeat protein